MRFIGNKENVIERIYLELGKRGIRGYSVFDMFSGATSVAKFFKRKGYVVYSSDILYFSYVLQKAYIENNEELTFSRLINELQPHSPALFSTPLETIVSYLNSIQPVEGFIFQNYTPSGSHQLQQPRQYFIDTNGKKIDAIRQQIEKWSDDKLINENEYFALIACLIETVPFYSNITGVYAAFKKDWDPRALKPLRLRAIETIKNNFQNFTYLKDCSDLSISVKADIYYLDPPYNHRQYAPNYHILETIARYDNPIIKGVTGIRDYSNQKSKFCNAKTALVELERIAKYGDFSVLVLSYNNEGVMPQNSILEVLAEYGEVEMVEFEYTRFKSNSNGDSKTKKHINEQLYILRKK